MNNPNSDSNIYNYDSLKNSYKIVMEYENYIVLNDGKILEKDASGKLKFAPQDNETVKKLKFLVTHHDRPSTIGYSFENKGDDEIEK